MPIILALWRGRREDQSWKSSLLATQSLNHPTVTVGDCSKPWTNVNALQQPHEAEGHHCFTDVETGISKLSNLPEWTHRVSWRTNLLLYFLEPGSLALRSINLTTFYAAENTWLTQKCDFQHANGIPVPNSKGNVHLPNASRLVFMLRDFLKHLVSFPRGNCHQPIFTSLETEA